MKIITRYILTNLFLPKLLILLTLTSIIWLSQSLRYIYLIVNAGLGFGVFLKLALLMLPSLLMIALPIATFISILYCYNKLTADREIVALSTCGVGKFDLTKPALIIAVSSTLFSYFISLYLLPASYREFKDQVTFYKENLSAIPLEEGVFNSRIKGITIHIEEHLENGDLKGIMVHDARNPDHPITMMAETGRLIKSFGSSILALDSGNRQEINANGELSILYFDHFSYNLTLETQQDSKRWREPQERYIHELLDPKDTPKNLINKLKAEAHQRILWPLYSFTLAFIALIAVFPKQFNRRGSFKRICYAGTAAMGLLISSVFFHNLNAKYPVFIPISYGYTLICLFLSIFLLYCYKGKFKTK